MRRKSPESSRDWGRRPSLLTPMRCGLACLTWGSALVLVAGWPAAAAERVWDGGARTGDWSIAANWSSGAPLPGDDLRFPPGAPKLSNTNDYSAATVFNRITYTGAGYTASGNAIALTGGLVIAHGAGNTIVNLPIRLDATQTFEVSQTGATLFLNGAVSLGRNRGENLVFNGAGQVVVSGNISGGGILAPLSAVRKLGSGTLWILQHPTYGTPTLVDGGILRVDGSLSNSPVTLNAGASLRGEGKVGGLLANAGSIVQPGWTTPDRMDVLGDVELKAGSTLRVRLNGRIGGFNQDQLAVQGAVTLGGTLEVDLGYAPAMGEKFTLVENDGTDPVIGTFDGLPEGSEFMVGTQKCMITYRGGTGNDVVLRYGPEPWSFSIVAAVSQPTALYYGGLAAVSTLISNQINTVNQRFNDPGVFDGYFQFVVRSIYQFTDDPLDEISAPHPDYDFKVVYDGFPTQGGGWYGDLRTIHHSWAVTNLGGPFANFATDGIVHEFGHSRGAIDMYGLNVTASSNAISGQAFSAVTSIMTSPYGIHIWDEYSQHLINKNRDSVVPRPTYLTEEFPSSIRIQVRDVDGNLFPNALVKLYPVHWFSATVTNTPLFSGVTGADGQLVLPFNPFGPNTPNTPWNIRFPNFLVSAQHGQSVSYAWMPLYVVQNLHFDVPFRPFLLGLSLNVSTFDSWRLGQFSAAELSDLSISGPNADPDGDHISNLMEYALMLDPHVADPPHLLSLTLEDGHYAASYTRRKLDTAVDLDFLNETTKNLRGSWSNAPITEVTDQGTTELVKFRDFPPSQSGGAAFFRLGVRRLP